MQLNPYVMPPLRAGQVIFDDKGRYVVPDPDSDNPNVVRHIERTSNLIHSFSDTNLLDLWHDRMIVQGLSMQPQLLARVDLNQDKKALKDTLQQIAAQAFTASGAEVRRERGTQLHYFTEAVDTGFCDVGAVPLEYRDEVQAYAVAHRTAGIEIPAESVERVLYNKTADVCGTADRWVRMPNGMYVIDDVKSGSDLDWSWSEISMQLAIYANAELMLEWHDGKPHWVPAREVEKHVAIVAHVPVDSKTCTLYQVDIERGWRGVQLVLEWRKWLSEPTKFAVKLDVEKWKVRPDAPSEMQFSAAADAFGQVPSLPHWFSEDEPDDTPDGRGGTKADHYEHVHTAALPDDISGMSPLDFQRARLQKAQALRDAAFENWKAGNVDGKTHKRRTKAMIKADELAELAYDGVPTISVFIEAARALIDAYSIEMDDAVPDPIDVDQAVAEEYVDGVGPITITATEGTTGEELPGISHTGPMFDRTTVDANGTTWTRGEGMGYTSQPANPFTEDGAAPSADNPFAAASDPVMDAIEEAKPTETDMAAIFDPATWTPAHIQRAQDRCAEYEATVVDALNHCQTAADMSVVYENFVVTGWSPRFTQHGQAVLAQNGAEK